jgi:flagellar biosynthesis chaperone FliJ
MFINFSIETRNTQKVTDQPKQYFFKNIGYIRVTFWNCYVTTTKNYLMKKMNKLFIALIAVGLLSGCQKEAAPDNSRLLAKVDSLQAALEVSNYTMSVLGQIGTYMDSIDANRKWIELNLETGLSQDDYVTRMKNINEYVQKAEWMIGELEKTRSAYAKQVKRLKNDIIEKDSEIKSLQMVVAKTQTRNMQLEETLTLTEEELVMSQMEQDQTERALDKSNTAAKELMEKLETTKAESLYSQGENMEVLAGHIQLAPKRKREALEQALKYYTESKEMGYSEANAKVEALKAKLAK